MFRSFVLCFRLKLLFVCFFSFPVAGCRRRVQVVVNRNESSLTFRVGFLLWSHTAPSCADRVQALLAGETCMMDPMFFGVNEYGTVYPQPPDARTDTSHEYFCPGDVIGFDLDASGKLTVWRNGEVHGEAGQPVVVPADCELYFAASLSGEYLSATLQRFDIKTQARHPQRKV